MLLLRLLLLLLRHPPQQRTLRAAVHPVSASYVALDPAHAPSCSRLRRQPAPGSRRAAIATMSGGSGGDLRLSLLRQEMASRGVHALVVPSGDAHLTEYVHPCYERRAFVSGFTGSAGTALVTADEALLWTDGRYFLQAEEELSGEWTLSALAQPTGPELAAGRMHLTPRAVPVPAAPQCAWLRRACPA